MEINESKILEEYGLLKLEVKNGNYSFKIKSWFCFLLECENAWI